MMEGILMTENENFTKKTEIEKSDVKNNLKKNNMKMKNKINESSDGNSDFPLEVYNKELQSFINDVYMGIGCPMEYVAGGLLATVSGALGKSHCIEIKKGWTEVGNVFLAIIGVPGMKKTPALKRLVDPLFDVQKHIYVENLEWEKYENKIEKGKPKNNKDEKEKVVEKEEKKKGTKKVNLFREVTTMAPAGPPYMPPMEIILTDTTFEGLRDKYIINPRGVIMYCDELNSWLTGLNQYKKGIGNDLPNYLSLWSQTNIKISRKGQGSTKVICSPFFSIVGGIQPVILSNLRYFQGTGFIDRFLFINPRDQKTLFSDKGFNEVLNKNYKNFIRKLGINSLPQNSKEIDPVKIRMNQAALNKWNEWSKEHYIEINDSDFPYELRGIWSKMEAYNARFILLLHVLKNYPDNVIEGNITGDTVEKAIKLTKYFQGQSKGAVKLIFKEAKDRKVSAVMQHMYNNGGMVPIREIYSRPIGGIKNKAEAVIIAAECVKLYQAEIIEKKKEGKGRPSTVLSL